MGTEGNATKHVKVSWLGDKGRNVNYVRFLSLLFNYRGFYSLTS